LLHSKLGGINPKCNKRIYKIPTLITSTKDQISLTEEIPKIVVIPGGTDQIGFKIVDLFLNHGASVVVPSVSGDFSRLSDLSKRFTNKLLMTSSAH